MTGKSIGLGLGGLVLVLGAGLLVYRPWSPPAAPPTPPPEANHSAASAELITAFCGDCHAMPDPATFPRFAWKMEVERGYQFFEKSGLPLQAPPLLEVVRHFESLAPEALPIRENRPPTIAGWDRLDAPAWPFDTKPGEKRAPHAISNLKWGILSSGGEPQLIACDMRGGAIASWNPNRPQQPWKLLARALHPAKVEIADLDQDGFADLLVADLGSFLPTDAKKGRALWYRGSATGFQEPVVLLDQVGRVTDIQVLTPLSPTTGPELVVAVFGWNETGEIHHLSRAGTEPGPPSTWKFQKKVLDERHGAIHVPVGDWNSDGKNDFVALFGQEHEAVTLFLNQGGGTFEKRQLYKGNHPGLGSSGIQAVDLDGDGDQDLLLSQGDVLDQPYLLKPYHGILWLENQGDLRFVPREIGPMYGVHRALALRDPLAKAPSQPAAIVSVAFLPREGFPQRESMKLESILLWRKDGKGSTGWSPGVIEAISADHVSCEVGAFWGPGSLGIAAGDFSGNGAPVTIYRAPASWLPGGIAALP